MFDRSGKKSATTKRCPQPSNGDYFVKRLLLWHSRDNHRPMPWKGISDPYKIWLSEIILQQTRVAQGWNYYLRILAAYPTIQDMAAANDTDVYKLWEGLGYYTRCRNLLKTARLVVSIHGGKFPASYDALLALPGIGPYTAAAIASFAFQLPYAVVDGNVSRVLARFFGNETAIDSTQGKKLFAVLAQQLLAIKAPGEYNQAIMDFGATLCMPQQPLCGSCPMEKKCAARHQGRVHHLPVKEKTTLRKIRWMAFFVFEYEGNWFVRERTEQDIWQNLYEFYAVETESAMEWNQATVAEWMQQQGIRRFHLQRLSVLQTQVLTHREVRAVFIQVRLQSLPGFLKTYRRVPAKKITSLPFPRIVTRWLEEGK
jgi:A/G-specific adenine glycosylase